MSEPALRQPPSHRTVPEQTEGLSTAEANKRLAATGYNELSETTVSPILKFLHYFWGPIPWMIEVAIILSAVVKHWEDLVIISILLVSNAVVGFWEEYKAGSTIETLKKRLAVNAKVKRDGTWKTIPARELVPGDLIRLHIGDVVAADARLQKGDPISVDQSALTGESLPVTHNPGDLVYSGSVIKQGELDAIVEKTGKQTYFGRTAKLTEGVKTVSHFQRAVLKIGNYLIVTALVLVALILAVSLARGNDVWTTVEFALVLTIAAIPVAMPTILSVTLAVGARLLAKKEAIVSRLASIEEIAGIDILCADKTGTLTQNKLTLGTPFSINGVPPDDVILAACLASRWENQDPIDLAILAGQKSSFQLSSYSSVHYTPFNPVQKRSEAEVHGPDGKTFKVTKGAFQVILKLSANSAEFKDRAEATVQDFARRGFRSLAVARTDQTGSWRMIGILPLFDPPRPDSKQTIATATQMGIEVKMVTGDQIAIAKETARELGMGTNIIDATVFAPPPKEVQTDIPRLTETIENANGFAQVFPEHKYRIVDLLQRRGHIVGMTGDGVNDSPPLKKADAGIAVAGATDAARSAADIVLLTPGLSVIVQAVKESRRIFQRMQNYATYRIAETIRVLLLMTVSILAFNFYPVTAIMIVLLALLNDGAILSIAYDRARSSNQPERWNMKPILRIATLLGVLGVLASFSLFFLADRVFHLDRAMIQTLIYLKLSVAGHLTIFVTRVRGPFWSYKPAPVLVIAVFGTQAIATLISVYGLLMTPIGWNWALVVWGYAIAWFLINDRVKIMAYRYLENQAGPLQEKRGVPA